MHVSRKSRIFGGTTLAVALSLVLGSTLAGAAYASDEPSDPAATEQVAPSPVTPPEEPVPAPEPAPAPQPDPAPAPEVAPVVTEEEELVSEEAPQSVQRVNTQTQKNEKVFVCKYVGTPGVDERLQTGQNPISVSVNAIQNNQWNGVVPGYFSDAHDRSYVLAYDTGQPEPDVSECPGASVPPPSKKVCDTANDLTWTANADLSEVTITLKPSVNACDVTLHSYDTDGPTWATSGTQEFVDFDSAHLTAANPTATLKVDVRGCFQQQDLAIGTKKYDGVENPLPHYPDSTVPDGLIDHWNGGEPCTPTNVTCETFADGGTSTDANANGWAEFASKTGGSASYVDGGLALTNVDGNSKVSWSHPTSGGSLALLGQTAVDYTHTSGATLSTGPGINAFVTFESGLTGTLVSEPNAYGQDWWLTNGSNAAIVGPQTGGGFGSNRHGTIDEWLALYPNATFAPYFAFAYGTGGPAAGVLHSVTIACTTYTFDKQDVVVVPPAPTASGVQQCIVDPITGDSLKQVLLDLANPNPTAPYTATTPVTLDVEADGEVILTVTLAPGQTIEDYQVLFEEDSGTHKIEVFNGETSIYVLDGISSDCADNEVKGNPDFDVVISCGSITYLFSYPVIIGEHEFANPKTFTYTDENGVTKEITLKPNETASVTVLFPEDSGTKTATAGIKGGETESYTVLTDCKPAPPTTPSGGIGTDGFGVDPNATLGGISLLGWAVIAGFIVMALSIAVPAGLAARSRRAVSRPIRSVSS